MSPEQEIDLNDVELILLKKTQDFTFDLDVMTKKQPDGRLQVYLGIDKIKKGGKAVDNISFSKDLVN